MFSVRVAPRLDPAELAEGLLAQGSTARPSRFLPHDFLVIESGLQSVLGSGMLTKGDIQVQDEAAGLVVVMLDPRQGESVLDCCSAPGGKTLFAAAKMGGKGRVVAVDVSPARLRAVASTASMQGIEGFIEYVPGDARQVCANMAASDELFDKVLLDAPCSGTGVLAKRADLRWRRRPEDLDTLCTLQAELMEAAAAVVRPSGVLVYSTCSIEGEENGALVAAFLERHPEFSVEAPGPESGIPEECLGPDGTLRMLPHVHGTDGAFAARLRKAAA